MKDAEWRGLVLQRLYEIRHMNDGSTIVPDGLGLDGLVPPGNVNLLANIAGQLTEHNLIRFSEFAGPRRTGRAKITAFGVDVIEGTKEPAITVTIDQSTNVHDSQHVQIGKGNVQNMGNIEQLVLVIDQSQATIEAKKEAKSLLQKVTENPLLVAAFQKLGWIFGAS